MYLIFSICRFEHIKNNTLFNQADYTKNKRGCTEIARCLEPKVYGSYLKKYNQLCQRIDMVSLNGVQPKLADKKSNTICCFVDGTEFRIMNKA